MIDVTIKDSVYSIAKVILNILHIQYINVIAVWILFDHGLSISASYDTNSTGSLEAYLQRVS